MKRMSMLGAITLASGATIGIAHGQELYPSPTFCKPLLSWDAYVTDYSGVSYVGESDEAAVTCPLAKYPLGDTSEVIVTGNDGSNVQAVAATACATDPDGWASICGPTRFSSSPTGSQTPVVSFAGTFRMSVDASPLASAPYAYWHHNLVVSLPTLGSRGASGIRGYYSCD